MPVYPSNISSAQEEVWGHYCTCLPPLFLAHAPAEMDQLVWSMQQVHPWPVLVLQFEIMAKNMAAGLESKLVKWTERPRRELTLIGPCCSIY